MLAVLVLLPATAQAQLGRGLDDPTGETPVRERPMPAAPGYEGAYVPPPSSEPVETSVATRLRALEASFQTLGARGPDYTGTVLSMVGGAVTIALAAVLWELGAPTVPGGRPDTARLLAPYYFVMGGMNIVRPAVVDFALRPNARDAAIHFQHMPTGTEEEQLARLRYGEEQLESLAEQSLIARIVDASLNALTGLAIIPAYLVPRFTEWAYLGDFQPLEAFVFLGPAISLVGAIITLASQSAEEQRWDAYRRMRQRLGVE